MSRLGALVVGLLVLAAVVLALPETVPIFSEGNVSVIELNDCTIRFWKEGNAFSGYVVFPDVNVPFHLPYVPSCGDACYLTAEWNDGVVVKIHGRARELCVDGRCTAIAGEGNGTVLLGKKPVYDVDLICESGLVRKEHFEFFPVSLRATERGVEINVEADCRVYTVCLGGKCGKRLVEVNVPSQGGFFDAMLVCDGKAIKRRVFVPGPPVKTVEAPQIPTKTITEEKNTETAVLGVKPFGTLLRPRPSELRIKATGEIYEVAPSIPVPKGVTRIFYFRAEGNVLMVDISYPGTLSVWKYDGNTWHFLGEYNGRFEINIQDNSPFDLNKEPGVVEDPIGVGTGGLTVSAYLDPQIVEAGKTTTVFGKVEKNSTPLAGYWVNIFLDGNRLGGPVYMVGPSDWWDTAWKYRREVNISNPDGVDVNGVNVRIELNLLELYRSGKLNRDASDIRVVSAEGKLLPHWVEGRETNVIPVPASSDDSDPSTKDAQCEENPVFRYLEVPDTDGDGSGEEPAGWYSPDFNDESWNIGNGPFGNTGGECTTVLSSIPSDLFVRKEFYLYGTPLRGKLGIAVGGGIRCYLNGVLLIDALGTETNAAYWNYVIDLNREVLKEGRNLLACWVAVGGENNGDATGYFDAEINVTYIERIVEDANIWIRVDVPASGTKVFVYYGNPDATSVETYEGTFYPYSVSKSCSGSTGGGSCSVTFDPSSDLGIYNGVFFRRQLDPVTLDFLMSGDFDYGGAYADETSCTDDGYERAAVYINGNCYGKYSTGYQDCTDRRPALWPKEVPQEVIGRSSVGVTGDAFSAVNYDPGCGYYYHFVWELNAVAASLFSTEPEVNVGPEMMPTITDAEGRYEWAFKAPDTPGEHEVRVEVNDGTDFAYVTVPLYVRKDLLILWAYPLPRLAAQVYQVVVKSLSTSIDSVELNVKDLNGGVALSAPCTSADNILWMCDVNVLELNKGQTYVLEALGYSAGALVGFDAKFTVPDSAKAEEFATYRDVNDSAFVIIEPDAIALQGVLAGFKYRRPITVKNQTYDTLTDVPVRIVVDTQALISEGKMRSDCGDVRFTESDGATEIPYYLERGCNTPNTVFWVKISRLGPAEEKTIYMYYGNPRATSASDGKKVFLFFDSFEEWNGWTQYGSGRVSQSSVDAWDGEFSLIKTTANDPNGGYKELGFELNFPFVLEAEIYRLNFSGGNCDRIGVIDDSGNGYGPGYCHNSSYGLFIDKRTNYSATINASNDTGADLQYQWYKMRFIWDNGTMTAEYYDANGNLQASTSFTDTDYTSFTRVYVFGGYEYLVDAIRIYSYLPNPPTVSVGNEENVPEFSFTSGSWLGGFSYRDPVVIEYEGSADLNDFQVKVVVDTQTLISEGKMRSDCGDVRFTESDGITKLPYYLEPGTCNTEETVFWVKMDVPAGGKEIFMYYGNPTATSESDPYAVFDFFDDFEEWNGWTQYGSGQVSQYCDDAYIGNCSLIKTTANDPNGGYKELGFVLDYPFVLEAYVKRINYTGGDQDRIGVIDDSGNGYGSAMRHASNNVGIDVRTGYSASATYNVAASADPEYRWYVQRLIWNRGQITAQVEEVNGLGLGSISITDTSYTSFTRVYVFGGHDYLVDAMRIRKYADVIPKARVVPYEPRFAPEGWAQFEPIEPYRVKVWTYVEVDANMPRDTHMRVDVYSPDGNLLCSFDVSPGLSAYDIAGCTRGVNTLFMKVVLSTDDPRLTPVLRFLKVSWIEDANIILYEPNDQYLFRNEGALAKGWLKVSSDCNDVNAYLYYRLEGAPRTIEEYNYDHFITRSADENVYIGDYVSLAYLNPSLGKYYIEVNVSNPSGADLSNYPVKVVIDTQTLIAEGKMRDDCGDIRVVDASLNDLNFWVREDTCNTPSTEIWVLLPSIPASGTKFYVFHGNLELTSASNPDAVFPEENTFSTECSGRTPGGVCSVTITLPAGKVVAPYQPAGYGELAILMSGDFDLGGAVGNPDTCDTGGYERSAFYVNGTCIGVYSTGYQDCTDRAPPNTPVDIRSIVVGSSSIEINADADSAVNYDPGCGYYYHYVYTLKLKLRPYVDPEPVATPSQSKAAVYPSGYYVSDALDTRLESPGWGTISWTEEESADTSVRVFVRSSPDGSTWSDWAEVENGDLIPVPSARYIQYKVEFAASESASDVPTFDNLSIVYYEGSAGWGLAGPTEALVTLDPNPYQCGDLNAGDECEPYWNITPKEKGEFRLIMEVTSGCGFGGYSNEKIFYSFARTQIVDFSSDKNVVAKGDSFTLTGRVVDELGDPVARRTVRFYDGDTFIGETLTDDNGYFLFSYTVPLSASLGDHVIVVKFPRDTVEYYWESNASITIRYSSKPVISDVNVYPSPAGIGDVVHVSATVTDEVGVESVKLEVRDPEGVTYTYDMNGGPVYEANVPDTWEAGTYTFTIVARNLDGVESNYSGTFSVEGYATYGVQVEKNVYGALEDVLLVNDPYWANPLSTFRFFVDGEGWYGSSVSATFAFPASYDPFERVSSFTFYRTDAEEINVSYTSGADGNAAVFSGQSYAPLVVPPQLMPRDGITIAAWVRVDSNVGNRYVVSLTDTAGNPIYALYSPDGETNVCFVLRVEGTEYNACTEALTTNTWYHVVATFDGSMLRIYLNGDLNGYATATGKVDYTDASEIMAIGGVFTGTGFSNGWVGAIDELTIYPFPLTDTEISLLASGKRVLKNPVALWKFENSTKDSYPYKENALIVNSRTDTEVNVTILLPYLGKKNAVSVSGVQPVEGREGNGGYFNGTAYLTVESSDFGYINTFTLAAWVRPEANTGIIFDRNYPSTPSWRVSILPDGSVECRLVSSAGNEFVVSGGNLEANVWSHVACVFNRFRLSLYVNGSEVNSTPVTDYGSFTNTSDVNMGVGFVGTLDDVRIYHVALAPEDVAVLASGRNVPWGISVRLAFENNDWNDVSGDWLIPVYSGGWEVVERSEATSGTPISLSGSVVRAEQRSAICNTGRTNVSGYLYVDVQTGSGSTWSTVPPVPFNDLVSDTKRTIPPGECLDVSSLYNTSPWNTDAQPAGQYRVRMILLAKGGTPSDPTTYITLSDGRRVVAYSEFNIVSATLSLSEINHYHLGEFNLNEYETTDNIRWIDVYVTARDSTALDVNVTLTLTDLYKYYAGFGPNKETKYYGTIEKDTTAVERWDNGGSGYYIPEDVTSGTYEFHWLVEMNTSNGPSVEDFTRYVYVHNLPSEFNSDAPTRIYYYDDRNGWGVYTFCMKNPWSRDINDVNVTINCPQGVGIVCEGVNSGTLTESAPSIAPGSSACFEFNIIATTSAVSGDYNFDINVEYLNPAGNTKFWPHQQRRVIEIRKAGILEVVLISYTSDVVRGEENAVFISKAHNTGTVNDENAWIGYIYPSDWNVGEANTDGTLVGDANAFKSVVPPDENIELNVEFYVPLDANLGPRLVRIETGTATNPEWGDFKNVYVTVWDRPVLLLEANDYNASVGESVLLVARLTYSDGTPLSDQRVNFEKNGSPIGAGDTNSDGYVTLVWDLSSESPGTYIVRAFFDGNSDIYVLPAEDNIVVNVGLKPEINAWLSDYNVGYGVDVNIEANVSDDQGVSRVWAVIEESGGTKYELNMTNDVGSHFYATFQPWKEGNYTITVYAEDLYGSVSSSDPLTLVAVASALMGVQTHRNFYLQGEAVKLVSPDWWDVRWKYRRVITVRNDSGTSLTQYAVRVELNTVELIESGKARYDLGDIRFVDGTQELNYWFEEKEVISYIIPRASDDLDPATQDADCTTNPQFKYYYCYDVCLPSGWYETDFDDSSWSVGRAPFGNTGGECTNVLSSPPDDLFVRKWVEIPGKVLDANLYISVGGGVRCYINGALAIDELNNAVDATYWNYTVNVTPLLSEGNNLLACWVANGGENANGVTGYLDIALNVRYVPYKLEDANFWVVVDVPTGEKNIYVYYGNPDAVHDNNADKLFPPTTLSLECSGSTGGGSCGVSFPGSGYTFAPYQKDVNLEFWMSGDFDAGGAYADETSCTEDSSNERVAVYINGDCYGTYSTGYQDCTDRQPALWPKDVTSLVLSSRELNVVGDTFPQVNYDPGCGYYYHFLWRLVNVRLRPYAEPEPTASVGTEETLGGSYVLATRTFKGYLVGVVERNEGGSWVFVDTDFNDLEAGTLRTFEEGVLFDLSSVWVDWNTYGYPEGVYRARIGIYAPDGAPLTYNGVPIEEWNTFVIGPPPVDVNISNIKVFDVNGAADPRTEGNLVDEGVKKTLYLSADRAYRFEIYVDVLNGEWNIADSNVLFGEINAQWNVLDIWYTISSDFNGGSFDGNVEWNTENDGTVGKGLTAVFKFIVDLNTMRAEEWNAAVEITHPAFRERNTWVVISTYVPDTVPPYAVKYALVNLSTGQEGDEINVIRYFEDAKVYAEWNETISEAYVEFNSTSSAITTDTVTPDGNYTEYNFDVTAFWLLGPHVVKLHAADLSGNWNHDLPYLKMYVWGIADVVSIDLNDDNVYEGETVEINCSVVDRTTGNAIPDYPVSFYVDGSLVTTAYTDDAGVASVDYTFTTFGYHTVECNVETNSDLWYLAIPPDNEKNVLVFVKETVPPEWNEVEYNTKVHRGELFETNVHWTDNHLVDTVKLVITYFGYRREITITNNSGTPLYGVQVPVRIDTQTLISEGKMRSDCGDVRFYLGQEKLSYYLEGWTCNTTDTVFWVRIPYLPEGNTTITMYYGNPTATSESDPYAVFDFFDDFEEWNGWTQYGSGQVSQDCTVSFTGSCSLHKSSNNDPNGGYKSIGATLGRGYILEAWINRNPSYSGGNCDRIGVIDDDGNGYGFSYCHDAGNGLSIDKRTNYSGTQYNAVDTGADIKGEWYLARLILTENNIYAEYYDINGSLQASTYLTDTDYTSFTRVYVFGGYDYWVDEMRVRKYYTGVSVTVGNELDAAGAPGSVVDVQTYEKNDVWAALEWNVPTDEPLGLHRFYQEANDPSGNVADTNAFEFNVWGWASISDSYVDPPGVNPDQNVTMYCKVIDRDLGTPLGLYEVNFYWDGNYLGTRETNADGWAYLEHNVGSDLGLHTFTCRIGPDPVKLYDPYPGEEERNEAVNVTESNDTDPPDAVEWNVVDINTGIEGKEINVYRGDELNFWSVWDENLSSAWVETVVGGSSVTFTATVDGNRAVALIDTNADWERGLHTLLMRAADEANNVSVESNSAEVNVYVWVFSNVEWVSPTGTVNRSSDMNAVCKVYEGDTGAGIPNYTVAFYSSLNGGTFLGTADTNADGYAVLFVDLNDYYGTYTFWCEITDDPARYYEANQATDSEQITVAAINLKALSVEVNVSSPVKENEPVLIEANVQNEYDPVDANVEIRIERREGSGWVTWESYRVLHSFEANETNTFTYVWYAYPGTYRVWVVVDPDNKVGEENEADNNAFTEINVHSWTIVYGDVNLEQVLGAQTSAYYIWKGSPQAVVLVHDSDLAVDVSQLKGMNIDDIRLADVVLGMAGSWDSLERTFDADGDGSVDATYTFLVEGTPVTTPVVYEDNRPVGIAYAGSSFDGNQPIVFISEVNTGPCSYAPQCDYVVKVPALLRSQDTATRAVVLRVLPSG